MMELVSSGEEEDKARKKISHQLLLNNPGACFLCLQDNQTTAAAADADLNGGIIDMSCICRYLNIDQHSLLLTSLQDDGGVTSVQEDVERAACAFSVSLCHKCLSLTGKLVNQIIELERAKLMVNYHLKSFHKLLEGDDGMEESLERIHDAPNQNNSFKAKLVQLLRKEATEKALKSVKKAEAALPQVILPKCQVPPPPPTIPSFTPPPEGTSTSIKTLLTQLTTSSTIPSKKPHRLKLNTCPFCSKIIRLPKFALHLVCEHSDKLLSSHFPPPSSSSSPPPPSESTCKQYLHSEVIAKAPKIPSSSKTPVPRLGCHLCGITYSNGPLLKHHFLITHTDNLVQELKIFTNKNTPNKPIKVKKLIARPTKSLLSSSPPNSMEALIKNLQEASLIIVTSSENDKKVTKEPRLSQCLFCEDSMPSYRLGRHLAGIHPDKLLAPFIPTHAAHDNLKNDNPNHFSQLCRKVLASQLSKAVKTPVAPAPTTISGAGDGGTASRSSKLGCHLCHRSYSDCRNLKYHFLTDHTSALIEQLIKMENVRVVGGVPKQDKLMRKKMGGGEKIEDKPVDKLKRRSAEEKTCEICEVRFKEVWKLRRHLVGQHREKLFEECRPEGMGEVEWRRKCKQVFGGEVKKGTEGKRGSKIFRCGWCPRGEKGYKRNGDLLVHLVYMHRAEMEGKFKGEEGMVEEVDGVIEEEGGGGGGDLDVKLDVGELDELLYPDMVLNELSDKEEEVEEEMELDEEEEGEVEEEENGGLEYLQEQYGDGGDNGGHWMEG